MHIVNIKQVVIFIRPFEKRDVLCRGNVRPSVCPSVRPRFPDFSSTGFKISILILVFTFSRWHDMSSLSCITIWSFWPSLQPKVGQTHILQSWPHESRWILQIWYTHGLLYTSRHKFRFLQKYYFQNFGEYFCAFWIFRSFPGFCPTCFEISVWNLVYTCSRWCYTSSSSFIPIGTLWPTLHPKIGQSHLSAFMALKII